MSTLVNPTPEPGFHPYRVEHSGAEMKIFYRRPSNMRYGNGASVPDDLVAITYEAKDGVIAIKSVLKGKMYPQEIVPERAEWDS